MTLHSATAARTVLVCVGIWQPGTGFTRVLRAVLGRLEDAYDVHFVGVGYRGPVTAVDGFTLHPTETLGGDVFGAYRAAELVEELDARAVLLLYDFWMLHSHMRTLARVRDRAALVAYLPLDGAIVDDRFLEPLHPIDRFVAYTRFGQQAFEGSIARMRRRGVPFTDAPVERIPHGVDGGTFHPLGGSIEGQLAPLGRAAARAMLFHADPGWRDAFIVLNANRPLERKRIDLTLEGFGRFARDKGTTVKLWLHHAIMDAEEHAAIRGMVDGLGLGDRVRLSEPGAGPLADAELNVVYNACEVGINTALGEGWGLVSFEHAATGAAQVVPDNSACGELWQGAAELVETDDSGVPGFTVVSMRTPSVQGVADALERLHRDPEHLGSMSRAAYANATRPEYHWEAIAAQWRQLIDGAIAEHSAAREPAHA